MSTVDAAVIDWLLEGDPAIRWQVQRDLLEEEPPHYEEERSRVAIEGWGERYLSYQGPHGIWANGLYSPKWKSTFYTMLALRFLGLTPGNLQTHKACKILLDEGFREDHGLEYGGKLLYRKPTDGSLPPLPGSSETCITSMGLAILAYFQVEDERIDLIAEHLLSHQMADGGWNCQYPTGGATHASFNTTLVALEGLREYRQVKSESDMPIEAALARGREFLLRHRLYRSHRTGNIVNSRFTQAPSQPTWRYNYLSALDHFRASGAMQDQRLQDAIDLLRRRGDVNGRWPGYSVGTAASVWFQMEAAGEPSRWNTLRALRVLKWWESRN